MSAPKKIARSTTTTKPAIKSGLTIEQLEDLATLATAAENIQRVMMVIELHAARVVLGTGNEQQRENALIALFANLREVATANRTVLNSAAALAGDA
jgi:hypothetical protein